MDSILDLVATIREQPGIMLGRPCAAILYTFLQGFAYARKDTHPGDFQLLSRFNRHVRDHYGTTSSQGWAKIIEFYSPNDAEEIKLFWSLWDSFLAKQTAKGKVPVLSPAKNDGGEDEPARRRRRA